MHTFTRFFKRSAKNMVEVKFDVIARTANRDKPVMIQLREKLHESSVNVIELTLADALRLRKELSVALAPHVDPTKPWPFEPVKLDKGV